MKTKIIRKVLDRLIGENVTIHDDGYVSTGKLLPVFDDLFMVSNKIFSIKNVRISLHIFIKEK